MDPLPGFRTARELPEIDPERVPRHVAAVMDGNGRWATQRGLKRTQGHAAGEEALFDAVEGALEPAAFVATTVNVYGVPFVRPVTTCVSAVLPALLSTPPAGFEITV